MGRGLKGVSCAKGPGYLRGNFRDDEGWLSSVGEDCLTIWKCGDFQMVQACFWAWADRQILCTDILLEVV